jgi:hypothetical protein
MTTPPSFPALAGQGWSVHKRPSWSTRVAPHVSGREVRVALYATTLYEFEVTYGGLDSTGQGQFANLGSQGLQILMGLFNSVQGQFGTFLYSDPTDNTVTGQDLGLGTGTTTSFTFARTLGGFNEVVSWVTSVANVYLNGIAVPPTGIAPPPPPVLSQTAGGSLGAQTCFVVLTLVTPLGETLPSAESSLAAAADNLLGVASPAVPAQTLATAYNVYAGATSGAETLQNATPIAIGTAWTEPTSGLTTNGAVPPITTATGWSLVQPNALTFATAPPNSVTVSSDFSYAFVCRFLSDQADFENFMQGLWSVDSLKFRSVKP